MPGLSFLVGLSAVLSCWIPLASAVLPTWLPHVAERATGSLDTFIASERSRALQGVLDNIGAGGSKVPAAEPGLVVASPSKEDPNYFYTWTRDSALTLKVLIDMLIDGDTSLQPIVEEYISAQATLQAVASPSGDLTDGTGLGEPKFEVNFTAFTGPWGRPQRDGPALRATALITYSQWLLSKGGNDSNRVDSTIWPIISNDLNYVGQYWNSTGFDLWEEVDGSSFFATAVQHRALVEGQTLAKRIGKTCAACESQTPQVLCFLSQSYWNSNDEFVVSNINTQTVRNGRDADSILGSIHTFDPAAGCDDTTFQPCSPRALANHKAVVDSFRPLYGIDAGYAQGQAVAIGRYTEDVYFGGNPWYLTTLSAAEQLYDALYQFDRLGCLDITPTSLAFFQDLVPAAANGRCAKGSQTYNTTTQAVKAYADGFLDIVQRYTPADGSLTEQFSRDDGHPLSAVDLTWSYASFLTATNRRAGIVPTSWSSSLSPTPPATCAATSAPGTYAPPPLTCSRNATQVTVTFDVREMTIYGESVFVNGSAPEFGARGKGVELHAYRYRVGDPLWSGTAPPLPAGERIEYKYYKTGTDGVTVIREGGENHVLVVPEGCTRDIVVSDIWQE
ncbi:hypothetical protein Q9189_006421 [Teloschistes chrysophthalmus]